VVRNPWVWGALILCTGLLVAAVYMPGLNTLLKAEDPGLVGWGLVLGASLLPWLAGQLFRSWSPASAVERQVRELRDRLRETWT
jgi:Ca2+-transporting ATPase